MRNSSRIVGVSGGKADWSTRSQRKMSYNIRTGEYETRKPRRIYRSNECVMTVDGVAPRIHHGQKIMGILPVRINFTDIHGNVKEREVMRGMWGKVLVQRTGWAYGHTKRGKTPGQWAPVSQING